MTEAPSPIQLTEAAAKRLQELIAAEGKPLAFRVSVAGGGCSGFTYQFDFAEQAEPGDVAVEQHGVKVLVDDMSLLYVLGSTIDYVEDLIGASFRVENPNAQSSCGCGSSFSV